MKFQNVRFAYGEKDVLHNISFPIPQHTMTALAGPSGGGKSRAANLLARFWDVGSGKILVRGKNVREEVMEAGGLYRDFVTVRQQNRGWNRRS